MRGTRRISGCVNSRQLRASSGTGPSTRTRSGSASPSAVGSGPRPAPDFIAETRPRTLLLRTGIFPSAFCPRGNGKTLVETDELMLRQFLDALRFAVAFDVEVAGIDRPDRV